MTTSIESAPEGAVPRAPTVHDDRRRELVRRGRTLSYLTLGYNVLEGIVSLIFGWLAGSIALVGFGIDSLIEVTSSFAALWRLRADLDVIRRERVERMSLRIIGFSFVGLALYILVDAGLALARRDAPSESVPGIVIAALSIVVMPLLARAKRKIAVSLGSRALHADATQTDLCMYLSAIVLGGLVLNALLGWWWADPIAAIAMTPFIAGEGIRGLRAEDGCACA
jgi:divalent metal cation (Fe/Co/Zn/Cd) transporter